MASPIEHTGTLVIRGHERNTGRQGKTTSRSIRFYHLFFTVSTRAPFQCESAKCFRFNELFLAVRMPPFTSQWNTVRGIRLYFEEYRARHGYTNNDLNSTLLFVFLTCFCVQVFCITLIIFLLCLLFFRSIFFFIVWVFV